MGIDDLVNKGKDLFDQHKDKLNEETSDKILDAVADAAKGAAGAAHADKIDAARDAADKALGDK
ncbi:MAG: hypothetical protein E6Q27_05205 [Aeromicrobium sp.]|nr:MAG: hypothetical protein E6Q27_05205 [Aeromicrobium sp.]